MDWGFVTAVGPGGGGHKLACFAMVCHHRDNPYVAFFPNARQENLPIGMVHAFVALGSPTGAHGQHEVRRGQEQPRRQARLAA